MMNFRQELVGVFGYPVDENPTVVIQDAAFAAKGLFWHYLTLMVRPTISVTRCSRFAR